MRQWVEEQVELRNESIILLEGLDEALVGFAYVEPGRDVPCAVYDEDHIITMIMDRDELDWNDAEEFYRYNIEGLRFSEGGPIFIQTPTDLASSDRDPR